MRELIIIKNNYLTLTSEDESLLKSIETTLTFKDTSQAFSYGRYHKDRVKLVCFVKWIKAEKPTLKIPIGFLDFILDVLSKDRDVLITDDRPVLKNPIPVKDIKLKGIELHDHQKEAVEKILNKRRGIIMAPTGAGKTEMFLSILYALPTSSLVLFNRQQLALQTAERAISRGLDVGVVQGKNVLEKKITMATVQSVHKIEKLKSYMNLILDEVHHAGSNSYAQVLKLPHWNRVYGFSATPLNPNKVDLFSARIISQVGPIVYEVPAKTLIEKGLIAKPKIYMIKVDKPHDIEDYDYMTAENVGIKFNKDRHEIIKKIALDYENEKVLVLTKYVDQGKQIAELLDANFIWHETPVKERLSMIERFEKDEIKILVASRILDEGIDIKNFGVLIIASAGISFQKTIQRLGRGLRITENKKEVLVFDFYDEMNPKLEKHSKSRIKTYERYGYNDITTLDKYSYKRIQNGN